MCNCAGISLSQNYLNRLKVLMNMQYHKTILINSQSEIEYSRFSFLICHIEHNCICICLMFMNEEAETY